MIVGEAQFEKSVFFSSVFYLSIFSPCKEGTFMIPNMFLKDFSGNVYFV